MTRKVVSPIALDKSINTTEQTPRNIADVLAQQLAAIKTAIESGNGNLEAAFVCYYGVTTATQIKEAIEDGKVPYFYYNGAVAQLWKVETDKYTFRTTNTRSVEGQTILDVVDYVVNGSVWSTITREVSGGSSSGQSYIASVNSLADFDTTGKSGMQDLVSVANVPADGVYQVSVMLHITPKTASATKSDLVFQFTSSDNTGWPNHTFHAVVDDSQTFAQQLSFSTSVSLKAGQNTLRIQCGNLNTEYLVFVDELTLAQLVNGVYHNGDDFDDVHTLTEAPDFNNDDGVLVDGATGGPRFMLWTTLANKVLGFIKSLSTTITAFRTGDVIPVDGPDGTAKMEASLIATSASLVRNTFDIAFKQNMVRKVRQAGGWVDSVNTISYPANLVAQKNLYFVPKAGAKIAINVYGDDDTTLIGSSGFQTSKILVKKGENFVVSVRKVDESYLYPSDADDVFYIEDAGEIEGLKAYLANGSFSSSGVWQERSEDAKNVSTNEILFAEKAVRLNISSNVRLMVVYWNDTKDTQKSFAYWLTNRTYTIPKGSWFSLTFRNLSDGQIIPSNVIDEFTCEEIDLSLGFYKLTASGDDYIKTEDYTYLTSDIKKAEREIVLDVSSGFKVTTLFWNDDKLKTYSYYRGVSSQTRPVTIPKGMLYSYSVQTNTGTALVYADASEVINERESYSIVADGMLSKGCTLKETDIVSSGFVPQYKEFAEKFGFVGRWFADVQDGALCMQTTASGSEIHFKTYQCTSVSLQFKLMTDIEPTYIAYNIDGGAFTRLSIPNDGIVTITLTDSYPHYVRVVMDSCFFFMGDTNQANSKYKSGIAYCFVGGSCNQGGRIVSVLPTNKSIVFFGDSITEGLGALGEVDINEPWDERHYSENSSSIASWPFVLSQMLNVIPFKAGYGSDGYMRDDGSYHKFLIELTTLKENLLASEYIPDLVILAHGQNDYDVGDYSTFVSSAREAFEWCHSVFPGVQILQVVPFARSGLKIRLEQASSGLPYVHVIDTTGWNISTNGDGVHPDVAGHLQAATLLEPIVKPYLY